MIVMVCPVCGKTLNLLPGPHQDEIKVVGLKKGQKYGITPGVYHLHCYRNAKKKQEALKVEGGVCDDLAACKVQE